MTTSRSTLNSGTYSYQQHFQMALSNFELVIREERLLKRIQKSKNKTGKS